MYSSTLVLSQSNNNWIDFPSDGLNHEFKAGMVCLTYLRWYALAMEALIRHADPTVVFVVRPSSISGLSFVKQALVAQFYAHRLNL